MPILKEVKLWMDTSYKDISTELGIKNAAVHYHYRSKRDLGVSIIQRARAQHKMWRQYTSSQSVPVPEILNQLFGSYVSIMESGKNICLGGSLLTDFYTLPEEMQPETRLFATEML